ncbi:MAG TPA: recombinase family protein [Candidatus Baltobacteraceae bacterium]|nr:recombinase family protein [Candidatus Baltobacteraceae bacterium]
MRVVTYARVSTVGQEKLGQSLPNQERAFAQAAERYGWTVVRHYREAASAKSVEGRAEFSRMIADLQQTKPQCIVVDTLDRFTRNLREGLNLLEELRGHSVGLLPLDWRRERALNVDDDRDWSDVVDDFTGAERERRRISNRIKRSYEGKRERGAVLATRTPFGLERRGEHFIPGAKAWVVQEAENRVLQGDPLVHVLQWLMEIAPESFRQTSSLRHAFGNEHYLLAGARTLERHQQLAEFLAISSERFSQRRKHEHEFTGVFLCGRCDVPMFGRVVQRKGLEFRSVSCSNGGKVDLPKRHQFTVAISHVESRWREYISRLIADPGLLERWDARQASTPSKERDLNRQLARFDQSLASLKQRRDAAFDLLADKNSQMSNQARKALAEVDRDEMEIAVRREAALGELARCTASGRREVKVVAEMLASYRAVYENATTRGRNELNRLLVHALGDRPMIHKTKQGTVYVTWDIIDRLPSRTPA